MTLNKREDTGNRRGNTRSSCLGNSLLWAS